jgi:hypothetical protein
MSKKGAIIVLLISKRSKTNATGGAMPGIIRALLVALTLPVCGIAWGQTNKDNADDERFCFYNGQKYSLGATLCTYKDTFQVCLTPMYDYNNGATVRRAEKDAKYDGPHWASSGGNGFCVPH